MIWFVLAFIALHLILYGLFKFKLNQAAGVIIYTIILVILRFVHFVFEKITRYKPPKRKPKVVINSVKDYLKVKTFDPYEVVVGLHNGNPIKINLLKGHTLLGATTGGGKSWLLHSLLIQLFSKTSEIDVYIIDMKGQPDDYWKLWEPVVKRSFIRFSEYFTEPDPDKDRKEAYELLREVHSRIHKKEKRKVLLILEEVGELLQDQKTLNLVQTISAQIRLSGSVIATVQRPKGSIIDTFIRDNFARRICGVVTETLTGKLVLGIDDINLIKKRMPNKPGEYLMKEIGKKNLISLNTPKPDLTVIPKVVSDAIEVEAEKDDRLKLFMTVANEKIMGVRKAAESLGFQQAWVNNAYKNYAQAGAFVRPETKGKAYTMIIEKPEGFSLIKKYIDRGLWEENLT